MGQELHLHNYIVNGEDNENGADRKQKNIKEDAGAAYTSAITTQNTSTVLKWRGERELKGRRKSILNISFQSNVNNLCCLCFLLLLFIYLLLSFQQPACFSKASWTGKLYKTFEFSFKRLSACLFIYFFFFTLVLLLFGEANAWSFDEKQTWHVFFSTDPKEI